MKRGLPEASEARENIVTADLGEDSGCRAKPCGTSHESIRNAVDAIPTTVASATANARLQPLDDGRAV
jgi:hypothetical protein